jgi:uncharacterized delta-60 repeat protein
MKAIIPFLSAITLLALTPKTVTAQSAGTPDATFGINGRTTVPFSNPNAGGSSQFVLHTDGRVVAVSVENDTYFATRFLPNGALDPSFGNAGIATGTPNPDFSEDVTLALALPNGKTLIVLNTYSDTEDATKFVQLDASGALDPAFGQGGILQLDLSPTIAEEYITAGVVLPDGKLLLTGYVENPQTSFYAGVILRLNPNGSYDNTFNNTGRFNAPILLGFNIMTAIIVQPDNKVVAAGSIIDLVSQNLIGFTLRLNSGGMLDLSYGTAGIVRLNTATDKIAAITDMVRTPDGKLVLSGLDGNFSEPRIVRLNPNGSLDNTFGTAGVSILAPANLNEAGEPKVELQSDGKILLCIPALLDDNGTSEEGYLLARYNAEGNLDAGFGDMGIVTVGDDFYGIGVALQPDGKILVGGVWDDSDTPGVFVHRYNGSAGVSTNEILLEIADAKVFPNPARYDATLRFQLSSNKQLQVDLADATGRICTVLSAMRTWEAGAISIPLSLAGLPTGNYWVRVSDNTGHALALPIFVQQ